MIYAIIINVSTSVIALLSITFFTLMEQNILSYVHIRTGPSNTSWNGLLQPLADAVKLFSKSTNSLESSNYRIYWGGPILGLFLALTLWSLYPDSSINMSGSILLFLAVSSVAVFPPLLIGWASNSNYPLIGGLRSISQTISYEINIALVIIGLIILSSHISSYYLSNTNWWSALMLPAVFIMWGGTLLAETNRTPFDLAEGESELVSGFNTEYGGQEFAIIFIAEYLNIIIVSLITSLLILGSSSYFRPEVLSLNILSLIILFILVRGSYPRMRYDRLMSTTWTSFLPSSLLLVGSIIPI